LARGCNGGALRVFRVCSSPLSGLTVTDSQIADLADRFAVPRWLREGLLIVVSVLLGFGVSQYGQSRDERRLAARILRGVLAEIELNRAAVQPLVPIHHTWLDALDHAKASSPTQSALDLYFATRPPLPSGAPSPFPFLRHSAWDASVSSGALRLIDFDVVSALSEIYMMQDITTENIRRLATGALSSTATYDAASRPAAVRLLWLTLADIESAESSLVRLYNERLPLIRTAAGRAP